MKVVLLLAPVVLSCWLLGAHVLRSGILVVTAGLAFLPLLLFVRRPWVPLVFQSVLVVAGLEWLRTIVVLVRGRMAAGEPWGRMVVILGAVVVVTIGGMLAFRHPEVRVRYRRQDSR